MLLDLVVYCECLLVVIVVVEWCIVIVVLYLEDDDGGCEVFDVLYVVKVCWLVLEIVVFVDWYCVQCGLIGKVCSEGNVGMYCVWVCECGDGVVIYGVLVQNCELFGVLYFKGMVIDDMVFYFGVSFNDVYLVCYGCYWLDCYYLLCYVLLVDVMVGFVQCYFMD